MNSNTRERLTQAASQLFATHGYRGAPVRDICNLARVNPGAVSYHFGGKRQLYRAVLRQAAARLAAAVNSTDDISDPLTNAGDAVRGIFRRVQEDPVAARLLLRDLADGGAIAVEVLEPGLRGAVDALSQSTGLADSPAATPRARGLFLRLAAPLFMLSVAWPLVAGPLDLQETERELLLDELIQSVVRDSSQETGSRL